MSDSTIKPYAVRGGSWIGVQDSARAAFRSFNHPINRNNYIGFRVLSNSPIEDKSYVLRGGSWNLNQDFARADNRFRYLPGYRYDHVGFRLVSSVPISTRKAN